MELRKSKTKTQRGSPSLEWDESLHLMWYKVPWQRPLHMNCVYLERQPCKGDFQEEFCLISAVIIKAVVLCFHMTCIWRHRWTLVCLVVDYYWSRLLEALCNHDWLLWGIGLQAWEGMQQKRGTDLSHRAVSYKIVQIPGTRVLLVLMLPMSCGEAFDLSQLAFLFWKVRL